MFLEIFRFLLLVAIIVLVIMYAVKKIKKIYRTDSRKEAVEDAKIDIVETLEEGKGLPKVDVKETEKSREKIKRFLKEGEKNNE